MTKTTDFEPWFCTNCYVPPFNELNNTDLKRINEELNDFEKHIIKQMKGNIFNSNCSICKRKINKNKTSKAMPCKTCFCLVHRKCTGISLSDLNNSKTNDFKYWECTNCMREKFAFTDLEDEAILKSSFNSNFDCKCQIDCDYINTDRNLILQFTKFEQSTDQKLSDGPDYSNQIDKCFDLEVNFDYYSLHQFHKLTSSLKNRKKPPFSLYHTNIQSLNCNFDRLHAQLAELNYPFDIIALSEVWNPLSKKTSFKPGTLHGYKSYCGTPGTTIKSGCGLYIKDSLKKIDRKDLNISFCDEDNEFQFKWIEIVNAKAANILVGVWTFFWRYRSFKHW